MKKLPGSTLLELKQDINTPAQYVRAGEIKTKKEWKKLFPGTFFDSRGMCEQWFIDKTPVPVKADRRDVEYGIVDKVFTKHGLMSCTYRDAAVICMRRYKKLLIRDIKRELKSQIPMHFGGTRSIQ